MIRKDDRDLLDQVIGLTLSGVKVCSQTLVAKGTVISGIQAFYRLTGFNEETSLETHGDMNTSCQYLILAQDELITQL